MFTANGFFIMCGKTQGKRMHISKLFLASLTVLVFATGQSSAAVISHWKFEEGPVNTAASGADSLLDSSGNNLHMTPLNGPIYRAVPNPGSTLGLEFGSNRLASRPDNSLYRLTSMTIEAFVRFRGGTNQQQFLFLGDWRGGRDPFFLGTVAGKVRFNISDLTLDRALDTPGLLPTGRYVHVAATLDHTTDQMKIFLDGVQVATRSAGGMRPNVAPYSTARISIGALDHGAGGSGPSIGQHFNGDIDEVRLSNVALSPEQFLNAPTAAVPEPSSLVLWSLGSLGIAVVARRRQEKASRVQ